MLGYLSNFSSLGVRLLPTCGRRYVSRRRARRVPLCSTQFAEPKRPASRNLLSEVSMLWIYESLFPVLWIGFLLYWQVKAAGTKATKRLEPAWSRIVRAVVFLSAILLMSWPHIPVSWLSRQFLPQTAWTFWLGAAITAAGLLFAVWAREHLATNWSRSVTIKQDHQLIVTGPYAFVRHPIYTGILTGFLCSALALAQMRGIVAFVLISLVLWYKLRMEEQWMRTQFGATYEAYSQRTSALVPFVL